MPDLTPLLVPGERKIVLLVLDGAGDIPVERFGWRTPLEAARTPNLDALAATGVSGRLIPVAPGVTPGSVIGHLALFGYDPESTYIGRGAIDALGIGLELRPGDVVARANLATVRDGVVADRRAGRLDTEIARQLCEKVARTVPSIAGVEVRVIAVRQHRVVVLFRGEGLSPEVTDSDPQREGLPPEPIRPRVPAAEKMAAVADEFRRRAAEVLGANGAPANYLLLRGFEKRPNLPPFSERYGLRAAAIAVYPTYRGIARACGMDVLGDPSTVQEAFELYRRHHDEYDFFFIHYKETDSAGEDGDFDRKRRAIEELDAALPLLRARMPDVLAVTADHSTPVAMRAHSWHPVPLLVVSPFTGRDGTTRFTEAECARGGLGLGRSVELMPLLLAHACRLRKYGA